MLEVYSKDYCYKRYEIILKKSTLHLDEFQEYVVREIKNVLPKSPLVKAFNYTKKVLADMKTIYLIDN